MLKKITPLVERLFSLLVVFLLLASTTLWSGKLMGYNWLRASEEAEIVESDVPAPTKEQQTELGLEEMTLIQRDSITWTVKAKDESEKGLVISSMPFSKDLIGYAGTTPLFVYIDADNKVQSISVMENDETPGFFRHAAKGILKQWNELPVEEALAKEVDAVSGATYTSVSLIGNVKAVLAFQAALEQEKIIEPTIGWPRTIALFFVFALGLATTFYFRGKKWLRLTIMILNVGVTGFWCGQFLSLSILHGWIQNGVDLMLYLPTVVMLIIAIVMPYLGKKNHYCLWMCPYGSLQELAFQLPIPKIKVGAKVYKRMRQIRMAVLMLLLACLWMGFGLSILDYEPFSAFIINSAAPAVMVLAGIFVVAGIFIPHPWCQCLCPVGALLNLAEENK